MYRPYERAGLFFLVRFTQCPGGIHGRAGQNRAEPRPPGSEPSHAAAVGLWGSHSAVATSCRGRPGAHRREHTTRSSARAPSSRRATRRARPREAQALRATGAEDRPPPAAGEPRRLPAHSRLPERTLRDRSTGAGPAEAFNHASATAARHLCPLCGPGGLPRRRAAEAVPRVASGSPACPQLPCGARPVRRILHSTGTCASCPQPGAGRIAGPPSAASTVQPGPQEHAR